VVGGVEVGVFGGAEGVEGVGGAVLRVGVEDGGHFGEGAQRARWWWEGLG